MPVTKVGVAAQIISCVNCYQQQVFPQTENDCKVALNRLVRAYDEALKRPIRRSRLVDGHPGKTVLDHLVPVKVIMDHLLSTPKPINQQSLNSVIAHLDCFLHRVEITDAEDAELRKHKVHNCMPLKWDNSDIWARYHAAKIHSNIDA